MVFKSSRSHEMQYVAMIGSGMAEFLNRMGYRKWVKM
jgi:hypothetical protein